MHILYIKSPWVKVSAEYINFNYKFKHTTDLIDEFNESHYISVRGP